MMTTAVPMIVIHTDVQGLVLINGRPAGRSGGTLSLPTNAYGDVFITVLPEGDFLPRSVRVSFLSGVPLLEDSECEHIVWPDSVSEIHIKCPPLKAALPWEKIDSLTQNGIEYSLYKGAGLRYTVQRTDDNALLFSTDIKDGCTGSVRELDLPTPCIGMLADISENRQRLILLSEKDNKISMLADESGTMLRIDGPRLLCRNDLNDIACHIRLTALEMQGEKLKRAHEEVVFENRNYPQDEQETALALLQAVKLSEKDEAMGYLSPDYADTLSFDELIAFFGEFERVERAKYFPAMQAGAAAALIKSSAKNAYTASVYAFEFAEGKISLIKRYDG